MKDTLPPELEKRFDEKWDSLDKNGGFIHYITLNTHNPEAIKQFLAQALSEQREQINKQVEGMKKAEYQVVDGKKYPVIWDEPTLNEVIKLLKEQDD